MTSWFFSRCTIHLQYVCVHKLVANRDYLRLLRGSQLLHLSLRLYVERAHTHDIMVLLQIHPIHLYSNTFTLVANRDYLRLLHGSQLVPAAESIHTHMTSCPNLYYMSSAIVS